MYNTHNPEDECPDGTLLSDNAAELPLWLQKHVVPTRKMSGDWYPPRTIHLLLSRLQRYMREKMYPFNQDTPEFKQLMTTYYSYYRELRKEGVGAEAKPTEVLTDNETEQLWASDVLNSSTPENVVFFCNGKNFLLRGGAE